MIDAINAGLAQFSFLEWIGLFTGIIYVILSAQNKIICWFFGIISCACIAYHDFYGGLMLYSDGILQIFYVLMGFFGIYHWKKNKLIDDVDIKSTKSLKMHFAILLIGSIISFGYGYLMNRYSNAALPFVDAFTTIFSIAATILLIRRQLTAWIYFVFIDLIMSFVYYIRSWELYALLYFIYLIVALFAVWNWKRMATEKRVVI